MFCLKLAPKYGSTFRKRAHQPDYSSLPFYSILQNAVQDRPMVSRAQKVIGGRHVLGTVPNLYNAQEARSGVQSKQDWLLPFSVNQEQHQVRPVLMPEGAEDGKGLKIEVGCVSEDILAEGSLDNLIEVDLPDEESKKEQSNETIAPMSLLEKDLKEMTDEEYKQWLGLLLKLNPNCFNLFSLKLDDFHCAMRKFCQDYVKQNEEKNNEEERLTLLLQSLLSPVGALKTYFS